MSSGTIIAFSEIILGTILVGVLLVIIDRTLK